MSIFIGGNEIKDIKIGSTAINSVWIGANRVWLRTLLNPETGWNNSSSSGTGNSGSHYSNTVTITQACTLKFTASALSGNSNSNTTYVEVNTGSGFPSSGYSSYYWGEGGISNNDVAYGTDIIVALNAGDQVRYNYFVRASGTEINSSITVKDNSDQSVIDSGIVGNHAWTSSGGGSCFLADSLITMHDLNTKRIADIKAGDRVLGDAGAINQVVELRVMDKIHRSIYAINSLKTTEAHPIKTVNGWKAINPQAANEIHPELTITQLSIGDKLVRVDTGVEYLQEVESITSEILTVPVYNLNVSGKDTPEIEGNDTYIVDGVVVHNK